MRINVVLFFSKEADVTTNNASGDSSENQQQEDGILKSHCVRYTNPLMLFFYS